MSNKKGCSFKHLTWNDRMLIEKMLKRGYKKKEIADIIGCSIRTIYYEIKRSTYVHTNTDLTSEVRYNPDGAQERYKINLSKKGSKAKLETDKKQLNYIEDLIINQKYSPEACLLEIKNNKSLSFDTEIKSVNTVYRAIRHGLFGNLKMVDLPRHGKGLKKKKQKVQKRPSAGTSIEKRPDEVDNREVFGHWEMDCVIGKRENKKTLLVLTERKTREEIIELLRGKTTNEVVKALNRIEKRYKSDFYKVFKSITVDNGSEFYDFEGMEQALNRVGKRTEIYYCHARAPQERGTNEVQNHLVRRWFPKGTDFDEVLTREKVKDLEWWINSYPRKMFDGQNSQERFEVELEVLNCRVPA